MSGQFKSYFLRGLAAIVPTIVTIWIFLWGYKFINDKISIHVTVGLRRLIIFLGGSIAELDKPWINGALTIAGFLIALVVVCIVGAVLASVVGKSLLRMIERFIMGTPLLRQVYPFVKQVSDFLLIRGKQEKMFSRVVALEYPRKGIWSLGLVTGSGIKEVSDNVKVELLTLLIPSSPTPFTGYVIMVPKEQTIALDIAIEDAFRFLISAGVVSPGGWQEAAALPEADLEKNK